MDWTLEKSPVPVTKQKFAAQPYPCLYLCCAGPHGHINPEFLASSPTFLRLPRRMPPSGQTSPVSHYYLSPLFILPRGTTTEDISRTMVSKFTRPTNPSSHSWPIKESQTRLQNVHVASHCDLNARRRPTTLPPTSIYPAVYE